MNQVLFVGDTRILEVCMGVDCSCISVMCKAVAGVPWSEVVAEADMVAEAADAILIPVLCESQHDGREVLGTGAAEGQGRGLSG